MTDQQQAAIAETKSALHAIEALLSVSRELRAPTTKESIEALGIAIALEMKRINDAQPYLPSRSSAEAA